MNNSNISSVHFTSAEHLTSYYQSCGLSPAIKLESAKIFDYKKTTYSLDGMYLCSTKSQSGWGFEKQAITDVYFISYTYKGLSAWEMGKTGRVSASQQMCIIDSANLVQGNYAPGTFTDTIMIDAPVLHREFSALIGYPYQERLAFAPILPSTSKTWPLFKSIVEAIKTYFDSGDDLQSPIAASYLKQALMLTLLESAPHNHSYTLANSKCRIYPKYVSRAIDFMHYNADKPILISDIAEYSHTSSRNLQIGFKKYKDTTPMRFLRMIRLSKVRDEIISGCGVETWQAIALKWGFNDLMLFKKYYQQAYHELPDQTLMRFRMGIRKG
ncbi:helix-turn-helix domain-containing protein [Pseudomonas coleopterorum]|uniref:helix-turn-helix domain-containing protein n=1 Tax=Pseudomonas coleopterorum TaxID=1605838 RepID=UPI001783E83F|nr:helix-turn-helix domain-containing protein [Pseudomonas coleopterorum]MBD8480365.1 helix-turn-helix domain-containing protein [Pseudomonas coleopterorum]